MNTVSFLLALLVLIISVVAVFVNRLDIVPGVLLAVLSVAVLLLTWGPVVVNRRVA